MNNANNFNKKINKITGNGITVFGSNKRINKHTRRDKFDLYWINNDDERHREYKFNYEHVIKLSKGRDQYK